MTLDRFARGVTVASVCIVTAAATWYSIPLWLLSSVLVLALVSEKLQTPSEIHGKMGAMAGTLPALLTTAEVAKHLRVSRETVRLMCIDGDLPAIRVRNSWRIRADLLEAYVDLTAA